MSTKKWAWRHRIQIQIDRPGRDFGGMQLPDRPRRKKAQDRTTHGCARDQSSVEAGRVRKTCASCAESCAASCESCAQG
eukprot:g2491.t1